MIKACIFAYILVQLTIQINKYVLVFHFFKAGIK